MHCEVRSQQHPFDSRRVDHRRGRWPRCCESAVQGKIVAVERRPVKGHSYGTVHIAAFEDNDLDDEVCSSSTARSTALASGGSLKIPFKNENIFAEHTAADGTAQVIASVPDLIAILDNGSGRALGVPEFKYGYRVTMIGITCSPR